MDSPLPFELELSDPAAAKRYSRARSFLLRPAAGSPPPAPPVAPIFLPVTGGREAELAREVGFVPEYPAERVGEARAALACGKARLAFDPADPPPGFREFFDAGGSLRLVARDVHAPLALLAAGIAPAERVTLCAAGLPGEPDDALIAAAYLCGAALLSHPGIAVSLPGRGESERYGAALETLSACGLPVPGVTLVSCPTCARASLDIVTLAGRIHARTRGIASTLRVAVMGCEVNGPGEARDCDLGVAGGRDRGLLFRNGKPLFTVPPGELESALVALIEEATGERCLPKASG